MDREYVCINVDMDMYECVILNICIKVVKRWSVKVVKKST